MDTQNAVRDGMLHALGPCSYFAIVVQISSLIRLHVRRAKDIH